MDCHGQDALGGDQATDFVSAAYVAQGRLGATCYGDRDPSLVSAWKRLVVIVPPGQLRHLALFAGYTSTDQDDLAFVNSLDDAGTEFQMSVNLDAYDDDATEAQLTMAHEFAHIFTELPDQLDRSVGPDDPCPTWFDGEGCYRHGSVVAAWIDAFWTARDLQSVDPDKPPRMTDGYRRCRRDASFIGPYGATTPEEDFAETFAAYVFGVDATTPQVQGKFDWMAARPDLAVYRHRVRAAGLGPLDGDFQACGSP